MEPYDLLKEGYRLMSFPTTHERLLEARGKFDSVIQTASRGDVDLEWRVALPRARTRRAYTLMTAYVEGWENVGVLDEVDILTTAATEDQFGKFEYDTHWDRACYHQLRGDFAAAIAAYERAFELHDNADMDLYLEASEAYIAVGDHDRALQLLRTAGRFVCHDWYRWDVAWVYYFMGARDPNYYNLAIEEIRKMYWNPGEPEYLFDVLLLLAAAYARKADAKLPGSQVSGDRDKSRASVAFELFRRAKPDWTLEDERRATPMNAAGLAHWLEGCKLAGLA